nr:copper transporter [Vibrio cholerae]
MKPSLLALCISVSALVVTPVMAQSSATSSGQLLSQSDPLTLLTEQEL